LVLEKKQIEWTYDKTNVGIFISSDSYDVKLRAAKYLGSSAIFISNSSTTGDEVKDKLINMWLLGDCNEVLTTPKKFPTLHEQQSVELALQSMKDYNADNTTLQHSG